jgi:hypothetical protein
MADGERIGAARVKPPPRWHDDDGRPIACLEKIKVLNENYVELRQMLQDAFEDGLLIGCSEAQMRVALMRLVEGLANPYGTVATNHDVSHLD